MDTSLFEKLISHITIASSGCWIWTRSKNLQGYGQTIWEGKPLLTHRAMYIALHGPIKPKICICHHCDTPACINPEHLFVGSQKDNLQDMYAKGRGAPGSVRSENNRKAWTPERRAARSLLKREQAKVAHVTLTQAAGVPADWKYCPHCKTWFPRTEFQKNKARHDGLKPICRKCATIQTRNLRAKRIARANSANLDPRH